MKHEPSVQSEEIPRPIAKQQQPKNPLHGVTLEKALTELVNHHGWEELGSMVKARCFMNNPSMKSSLKFLRATPWARKMIEGLYLKRVRLTLKKQRQDALAKVAITDSVINESR
jgi:uncharacterized protein (DUF2132 family)